jgi:hypothetical protein
VEKNSNQCEISLTLNETLYQPVFVFYELTNFYTNHRSYVKSKVYQQLRNEEPTVIYCINLFLGF